jgi:hypothetical protein
MSHPIIGEALPPKLPRRARLDDLKPGTLSLGDGFGFYLVPGNRVNFCANLDTVAQKLLDLPGRRRKGRVDGG